MLRHWVTQNGHDFEGMHVLIQNSALIAILKINCIAHILKKCLLLKIISMALSCGSALLSYNSLP